MLQQTKNLETGRTHVSYRQVSGVGLNASASLNLSGSKSRWFGRQLPIDGTPGSPGAEAEWETRSR